MEADRRAGQAADLVARCVDALHAYLELGNTTATTPLATFVTHPGLPRVYDANCVTRVRAGTPDELDALLADMDRVYGSLSHRCVQLDPLAPAGMAARLVLDDYQPDVQLQAVLEGPLALPAARRHPPEGVDIRPVGDEADWAVLARLIRQDHEETAARRGRPCWDDDVTAAMVAQKREKAPAVQFFLAADHGVDCAFFSSWPGRPAAAPTPGAAEGPAPVGKVEDLFCAPDHRHRGIATALIACAVADCRGRGAGPVLIGAVADDTPKKMYAALGFRPLLIATAYVSERRP